MLPIMIRQAQKPKPTTEIQPLLQMSGHRYIESHSHLSRRGPSTGHHHRHHLSLSLKIVSLSLSYIFDSFLSGFRLGFCFVWFGSWGLCFICWGLLNFVPSGSMLFAELGLWKLGAGDLQQSASSI